MANNDQCMHNLKHLAHVIVIIQVTVNGEEIRDEYDDYMCLKCKTQHRLKSKPTQRSSFWVAQGYKPESDGGK